MRRSTATADARHLIGRSIAVAGGGIGGLTAALAFARSGAKVTVYEKAPALREVGAGLQITPNGLRVLRKLQLGSALSATGVAAQAVVPMDGVSGAEVARFDLTQFDPGYRFLHRAALQDLLARAAVANGVSVELDAEIADVTPDGRFTLNGSPRRADLVVGADGIHSKVRAAVGETAAAGFTGQVAFRALVPRNGAEAVARIWMAPGRHVVTYPISDQRLNVVAVREQADWAEDGWNHACDPARMREEMGDLAAPLSAVLRQVQEVHRWGLFRHPVARVWTRDRVALLGDAAHPTLPFLAQGANLAIEDAYVLARCCAETASLDAALARYQSARRARVARAIRAANANARNYHLAGLRRRVALQGLDVIGRVAPGAFLGRLNWLYGHDVTA